MPQAARKTYTPASESVDWSLIRTLTPEDFDDPNHPGSHRLMDPITIALLDNLSRDTGWQVVTHNKYGLRGCVSVDKEGHSSSSLHYPPTCSAVDFHFNTAIDPRTQAIKVLRAGFSGVGLYYGWRWPGIDLQIGFHVDNRKRPQIWTRRSGEYVYLLK